LFDKRFDILLEKESAVIDLSYENKDASIAAKTLSTLMSMYMEKRKTLYNEPRVELARTEMEASYDHALAASAAVQNFKHEHNLYSFEDERELLLTRRDKALDQSSLLNSASLKEKIAEYNGELAKLDALERDLSLLQKEADIADDAYALYSHKYDEAKAFEDLQHARLDSVRIIQPPSVPAEPKKWQWLIILAGFVLSGFSLLAAAATLKFLETGFSSADEVERLLGIKVLATFRRAAADMDKAIRPLVQILYLAAQSKPLGVITFISARKGEGASFIACGYAERLAHVDKKVLLIDAGTFSPAHYRAYGFIPQTGLVDVITSGGALEEAIHAVSERLHICRFIAKEEFHVHFRQVVGNAEFWKELSEEFAHIVIDAGSLQASFDGVTLAAKSDAVILVIESEKTPQAAVKHLRDTLLSTGSKIKGVVMNKYHHYIPDNMYRML
jgi:Mrp family chromosome partitioning ATPase